MSSERQTSVQKMRQLRELLEELNEWAAAAQPRAR